MYIPNLASQIIDANNNHQLTSEGKINFKGVLIVEWREKELTHFNVDVRLGQKVGTSEVLAEKPDVVIIATGGTPYLSDFKGAELCRSTWDGMRHPEKFSNSDVFIYDGVGRHQAPSCAVHLAQAGAKVNYATIDAQLA